MHTEESLVAVKRSLPNLIPMDVMGDKIQSPHFKADATVVWSNLSGYFIKSQSFLEWNSLFVDYPSSAVQQGNTVPLHWATSDCWSLTFKSIFAQKEDSKFSPHLFHWNLLMKARLCGLYRGTITATNNSFTDIIKMRTFSFNATSTYLFTLVSALRERSAMHFSSLPQSTKGIYKMETHIFNGAEQFMEILSNSQYGQVQCPNCRSCNLLMKISTLAWPTNLILQM